MGTRLFTNTWLYRQPKKKKEKAKKGKSRAAPKSKIEGYALKLQKNTPKAELWFRDHYQAQPDDFYNIVFGPYIPDVINKRLMYVIEIDEAHHETEEHKYKDFLKDRYYTERGYKVFRVKSYNPESLESFKVAYSEYLTTLSRG